MKVYLCGAINGCSDLAASSWREKVKKDLGSDFTCIDPMRRDYRGKELEEGVAAEIVMLDLEDIDLCDIVLYYFVYPSVGSAMEVFYAHKTLGKKVIVVNEQNKALSPWLVHHSWKRVKTLNSAITCLKILKESNK